MAKSLVNRATGREPARTSNTPHSKRKHFGIYPGVLFVIIMNVMNAAILTNEFPPEIYGGAGIHVKFLTQERYGNVGHHDPKKTKVFRKIVC